MQGPLSAPTGPPTAWNEPPIVSPDPGAHYTYAFQDPAAACEWPSEVEPRELHRGGDRQSMSLCGVRITYKDMGQGAAAPRKDRSA